MNKRTILRAAILAALAVTAGILGWLCFGADNPAPERIDLLPCQVQASSAAVQTTTPTPSLTETPSAELDESEKQTNSTILANRLGILTIGNKEIPIACNVDESTLEKSPGWMPDSALPGESGMCVILGHRNRNHLRPLEKVRVGEEITFTYPDGRTAAYSVTEIVICENTADWRLPSAAGDTLVLVTCYPFRYSGNAPGKYQIIATAQVGTVFPNG